MNSAKVKAALDEAMMIEGALGVCLVDYQSGMTLGTAGGGGINLEMAAAGTTEVMRSKLRVLGALGLDDRIEDVLITLGTQGGFRWSSQHRGGGCCDDGSTAFGSGSAGQAAFAGAAACGAAGASTSVLGVHRCGPDERGRGDGGRGIAAGRDSLVP